MNIVFALLIQSCDITLVDVNTYPINCTKSLGNLIRVLYCIAIAHDIVVKCAKIIKRSVYAMSHSRILITTYLILHVCVHYTNMEFSTRCACSPTHSYIDKSMIELH